MARTARASAGGICYHVLNRGNARSRVFHSSRDYAAFISLMARSSKRLPMRVLSYCLMPNHFHLVLQPHEDGDLSKWMHWLMTSQTLQHHRHHETDGHIWQGRFKAFPVQQDQHLLNVLRYVECNPLRAKLVTRAQDWEWSSLRWWDADRSASRPVFLADWPVRQPDDWLDLVNRPQAESNLVAIGKSLGRGRPLGDSNWAAGIASRLGLEATIRPRGRPRAKVEGCVIRYAGRTGRSRPDRSMK